MPDINCPNCNKIIPDTSTFCLHCGFKIINISVESKQIICPQCKKEIPEASQFCPTCGFKIAQEEILIKCPHCRKKIPEDSKRCPDCGYRMDSEVIIYDGNLMLCPNCQKKITQSSERCGYCGFELAGKNLKSLHVIWCPKCKADIISSAKKCYNCGYSLKRNDDSEEDSFDSEDFFDKVKGWIGTGIVVVLIIVIFRVCNKSPNPSIEVPSYTESPSNYESPSTTRTNTESTSVGRYIVNTDVIFAATSEANFKTLMNCITSNDREAVNKMVFYGQVKYLYKNDVVFLVKSTLLRYCIVRPEGSTEYLYVVCEQITPQ